MKKRQRTTYTLLKTFSVHGGNLVVESKGDRTDHGDYIYHKLSVPSDVDFKTIQTRVIADKLIVSADKMQTSPQPPPQISRTVASASPASSTSSSFRSSPTPRSFQQSVFDSKSMFPERNKLDSFGGLFSDPYMAAFPTHHGSNRTYDVTTNNDSTFVASVPLGREFLGHPEAVDISVSGQTVKLKVSDLQVATQVSLTYQSRPWSKCAIAAEIRERVKSFAI